MEHLILSASGKSMGAFEVILMWVAAITVIIGILKYALYAIILYRNWSKKSKERADFERRANSLSSEAKEALMQAESLFQPNQIVKKEQITSFLDEHKHIINNVDNLYRSNYKSDSVLSRTGLAEFHMQVNLYALTNRMEKNNQICHAIQELSHLTLEAYGDYCDLTNPTYYFTYSQMQSYITSLKRIEELRVLLYPKYKEYITDEYTPKVFEIADHLEDKRNRHNKKFIDNELYGNKTYFDTVLGDYPLDPQQRDSIIKLEDNCLVIASAGSGKTSTILGKAKYLVEKRLIAPSRILLLTYTKKAANELSERMKIDGLHSSTFHALAYQIIAQVTGQAPSICKEDVSLNVFRKLILENSDFLHAINTYIIDQQSLMGLEHDYNDAFSYFEDRKKYGIQALFPDVDGKIIFTRSEEEKRLVSMLTRLGVPFRYENYYQYDTRTPERQQYKPDFTIYYQDAQGQWKWIYLEHFAIDSVGNVPRWFGEGTRGGWRTANQKYNDGIAWKRQTHREHGTTLIETTSADFRDGTVETKLRIQLERCGVPIRERTDKELYELLVKRSKKLEKSVYTLILSFVTLMKANEKTIDGLLQELPQDTDPHNNPIDYRNRAILENIVKPFYEKYEQTLRQNYEIDFTDAIIQATALCRQGLWKQYEYILVDEFQDISVDRYKLLQALRSENPKTKLFCVGDDWQSIFRFAGSDMSLVYEFEKYFGFTEQCKIETTYRFHQPLIDKSSEFIMKNKDQKEKTIKTPDGDTKKTYLNFVKCDGENDDGVKKEVEKIIATIPTTQSVLLLGRYNYDAVSVGFKGDIQYSDNRMMVKIGGREIPFLSVHSAKGLEADNVILVNCNQGAYGFPSLIEDDPILDFVLSKNEAYPYAEERRLFYVAMTRARMKMYVLYDQSKPSPFIGEFLLRIERGSYLCPRCLEGKMTKIKEGTTSAGDAYASYVCSNKEAGCDFFETKYGDLTPPGILVTDEMTAQDIERLRENRRNARISILPHAPQTQFRYGTQAPVPRHTPVRGFAAPFPPVQDELQQGSADDLPF